MRYSGKRQAESGKRNTKSGWFLVCVGSSPLAACHSPLNRGMTFVEALVWVVVFVVSMMALIVSLLSFYRANTYTIEQAQAVSDARRSIERVVQTVREASYSSEGAYPIVAISTSTITFYADIDSDALVEKVRYAVASTTLIRGVVEPSGDPATYTGAESTTTVAFHVRNIEQRVDAFSYYDVTGATTSNVRDVRFIRTNMVVNVSPARLPNELTIRTSATLRNLR